MNKLTILFLASFCTSHLAFAEESVCYGTTSNGKLKNGVKLPSSGNNFVSYSSVAEVLGRTYVHSKIRAVVILSYLALEKEMPRKVYKYAETGFKEGGQFKPHKTHKNGLSIDFMVPTVDMEGNSVHLPTHLFNKWGYSIEFDNRGKLGTLTIDYEAMGAHIVSLHKEALKKGGDLWRVIFDPELQPFLFETKKYGAYLKKKIPFSKKRSWVRHDEHYHVDFKINCAKM